MGRLTRGGLIVRSPAGFSRPDRVARITASLLAAVTLTGLVVVLHAWLAPSPHRGVDVLRVAGEAPSATPTADSPSPAPAATDATPVVTPSVSDSASPAGSNGSGATSSRAMTMTGVAPGSYDVWIQELNDSGLSAGLMDEVTVPAPELSPSPTSVSPTPAESPTPSPTSTAGA